MKFGLECEDLSWSYYIAVGSIREGLLSPSAEQDALVSILMKQEKEEKLNKIIYFLVKGKLFYLH